MNADGSDRRLIYDGGRQAYTKSGWSPDGEKVVFSWGYCFQIGPCYEFVDLINPDGTGDTTIAPGFRAPAWSPDGAKIAIEGAPDRDLFTMNPDGANKSRISSGGTDGEPNWSPDGSKLAFTYFVTETRREIWTMNADGTGRTRLDGGDYSDREPAFSPDGTKIAFASNREGSGYYIYVMNADGSGVTRVSTSQGTHPDWQPIPGPRRSDYKNAAKFCNAERDFLGEAAFRNEYGTNGNGANAFGKCVSEGGPTVRTRLEAHGRLTDPPSL
jgi:Tol biopolymer transport system component